MSSRDIFVSLFLFRRVSGPLNFDRSHVASITYSYMLPRPGRRLNSRPLKAIADVTRGEYFYAGTAADLKKVYQTLNSRLSLEKKETEITALLSKQYGVPATLGLLPGRVTFVIDKQGKVHARISVDFPKEFGCYLAAPMRR